MSLLIIRPKQLPWLWSNEKNHHPKTDAQIDMNGKVSSSLALQRKDWYIFKSSRVAQSLLLILLKWSYFFNFLDHFIYSTTLVKFKTCAYDRFFIIIMIVLRFNPKSMIIVSWWRWLKKVLIFEKYDYGFIFMMIV